MYRLAFLVALLAVVFGMAIPAFAQDATAEATTIAEPTNTIIDYLTNDGSYTILLAAIETAGLTDTLRGDGPFTLFAPTDDAINAALEAMGMSHEDFMSNPDVLAKVLQYHVVPERLLFRRLLTTDTLTTAEGEDIAVTFEGGFVTLNGVTLLTNPDRVVDNGVVQIVDSVLVPPTVMAMMMAEMTPEATMEATEAPTEEVAAEPTNTIIDYLTNDGGYTLLLAGLEQAGLTDMLRGDGPFTIFAPTDDAINATLEAMGMSHEDFMSNPDVLAKVLQYHVVPERLLFRRLLTADTLTTAEGEDIAVTFEGGFVTLNGTTLLTNPDRVVDNGVVQIVDSVLVPPTVMAMMMAEMTPEATEMAASMEATAAPEMATPEATAAPAAAVAEANTVVDWLANDSSGQFSVLVAAIEEAGLADMLSGDGPFTVFAPTDDAFAAALQMLDMTQEELLANTDVLTQILQYHVVPERLLFRHLLTKDTLTTAEGEDISVALDSGFITLNGVTLLTNPDRVADNGVVQIVDSVLIPPSLEAQLMPEPTVEATEVTTEATDVAVVEHAAHIRFAMLSPDSPSWDVYLNGEVTELTDLPYPSVSAWLTIPAGTYTVNLAPTGTSVGDELYGPAQYSIVEGTWITIPIVGSEPRGTLYGQPILEDYSAIADGNARVTVLHAVEDGPTVDAIFSNGNVRVERLAYPGSMGNNDGAFVVEIPAGESDIEFIITGTGIEATQEAGAQAGSQTVLLEVPNQNFESGTYYFVAVIGTTGSPDSIVEATDSATVESMGGDSSGS